MQTPEPTLEALANRVAELEAQNHRLRKAGIALVIAATSIIAMGQAPVKQIVTADEFILKDSAGIVRAKLGFAGVSNEPTLTLIDANGRERANLTTEAIEFADSTAYGQKTRRARCPTHEPHVKRRLMINQAR